MKISRNFLFSIADIPRILYDPFFADKASEDQCDCACTASSSGDHTTVSVPDVSHSFNRIDPLLTIPLTVDYNVALGRTVNPIVLNHSALAVADHFRQARPLEDIPSLWSQCWGDTVLTSTLNQMIECGLLLPGSSSASELHEKPAILSSWLHITDRCNLTCSYCYVPHKKTDMSIEIGRAAIEAAFRSALNHEYQEVKFKYAGGEPLLRFGTVTELHQYAQVLAEQHSLALDGAVLSNGTLLTSDIIERVQALGLRLMISVDGVGQFHDCQRFFSDGHGSFEVVSGAIDLAVSYGLIPEISITVSGRNVEGLPELVDWVLERDLPFSFNFYRGHGLSSSETGLTLEEEKIIEGMLAAYKAIESNLPQRSLLSALIDRANFAAPHVRTCSVGQNYLVFDAQGQVAKCQMEIGETITDVHDPDPLTHIRESRNGIRNLTVEEKAECCDCQWRYWCAGGCPLLTYRTTGRYDLKSPNCTIYKALFPEVIRLEGLRLLRDVQ